MGTSTLNEVQNIKTNMTRVYKQSLQNFGGFGNENNTAGEYFYSQGMKRSSHGIKPAWSLTDIPGVANKSLDFANDITAFSQGQYNSLDEMFFLDDGGYIHMQEAGASGYETIYKSSKTFGAYSGMIYDQKGRLIYVGERYVGMYDGSDSYHDGTISVTNGSQNVVGSGTTFTAGMVGQVIRILGGGDQEVYFDTVATFTDATHITLTNNYAGDTGSGKSYDIFTGWDDDWKDLGASYQVRKQIELYEDYILIPIGNVIALIATTDDSLNTAAFTLPDGMTIVSMKANKTGLLIGATMFGRSAIILWDAYSDRSVTPWIWLDEDIKSIAKYGDGWIVITSNNYYYTNGYSLQNLKAKFPDAKFNDLSGVAPKYPAGSISVRDTLFSLGDGGGYNRKRPGVYVVKATTGLLEYIPYLGSLYGSNGGAMGLFLDNSRINIYYAYNNPLTSKIGVGLIEEGPVSNSFWISEFLGSGNNEKQAEAVRLSVGYDPMSGNLPASGTFKIIAKLCNTKKPIFQYVKQDGAASAANIISFDPATYTAQYAVGDEVTVLQGQNAGEIRHISSIDTLVGGNIELTLDSALSGATEDTVAVCISPFKKIGEVEVDFTKDLADLFFNVKNAYRGKKFLLKVLVYGDDANVEFYGGQFYYSDFGYK